MMSIGTLQNNFEEIFSEAEPFERMVANAVPNTTHHRIDEWATPFDYSEDAMEELSRFLRQRLDAGSLGAAITRATESLRFIALESSSSYHEHLDPSFRTIEGNIYRNVSDIVMSIREQAAKPRFAIIVHGFTLSRALKGFVSPIERSWKIVSLDDDWDGEGSLGYDESTWRQAVSLVVRSASTQVERHPDVILPVPIFAKGQEGSIDILWDSGERRLMINVPAEGDGPVTYHGFDTGNDAREVKGSLDPSDQNDWIVRWLTA